MYEIEFLHQCDVAGVRHPAGTVVDYDQLPKDWVDAAVAARFVEKRLKAPAPPATPPAGASVDSESLMPPGGVTPLIKPAG